MHRIAIFLQNRHVLLALRWLLAGIFLYAGGTKILAPQAFADSIATFRILPASLINLAALTLPAFEVLAALAIVFNTQRRPAILGFTLLTGVFLLALGSAIMRGIPVDCGCFGSGKPSQTAAWIALGRDIPLLLLCVFLYAMELRQKSSEKSNDEMVAHPQTDAP